MKKYRKMKYNNKNEGKRNNKLKQTWLITIVVICTVLGLSYRLSNYIEEERISDLNMSISEDSFIQSLESQMKRFNVQERVLISPEHTHTILVKEDGTVWSTGNNECGKLGIGNEESQVSFSRVKHLEDIKSVATGSDFSIALKGDGTVWGWGNNAGGQLGNDKVMFSLEPVKIEGIDKVISISAGYDHAVALRYDGTVCMWGAYKFFSPIKTESISEVKAISSGGNSIVALKKDGSVWESYVDDKVIEFTKVEGVKDIVTISAGRLHTIALRKDGVTFAWGSNSNGQLGNNKEVEGSNIYQIAKDVVYISAGDDQTIVLRKDGKVWTWGKDGTTPTWRNLPYNLPQLDKTIAVYGGDEYAFALKSDGTVWAWGINNNGQLGDGSKINHKEPVMVFSIK